MRTNNFHFVFIVAQENKILHTAKTGLKGDLIFNKGNLYETILKFYLDPFSIHTTGLLTLQKKFIKKKLKI